MEILKELEAARKAKRRADFAAYAALLASLDASGALPTAEAKGEFAELVERLGLTPADIESHAKSLDRHRRGREAEARASAMEVEAKNLRPHVESWQEKKRAAVEQLDSEGSPLLNRLAEIENALANSAWARASAAEEERTYPELYGVPEPSTEPVKPSTTLDLASIARAQSFGGNLRATPHDSNAVRNFGRDDVKLLLTAHAEGVVSLSETHRSALEEMRDQPTAAPTKSEPAAAERPEDAAREAALVDAAERESAMKFAQHLSAFPDSPEALAALTPRARELLRKGLDKGWVKLSPEHKKRLKAEPVLA
ncbi:MAG TPA: hypothetical protein VH253_10960 [Phycisphaerae bacterium]|nr:hypothetical protein [Phycisphaerae bacterium]